MIDRRNIRHHLSRMRHIKTWQLLVILFFASLLAATFLRLNNLGMIERRDAVVAADARGDQDQIRKELVELQRYVTSHMNTSLGNGVYLAKAYERDRDAALAAATETNNPSSAVYQQASIECQARFQGGVESFRNDYVQCVIERVSSLSSGEENGSRLNLPRADNYRYDFISPRWSPDLAGFTVLLCVVIIGVILIRILTLLFLRLLLNHRFKNI